MSKKKILMVAIFGSISLISVHSSNNQNAQFFAGSNQFTLGFSGETCQAVTQPGNPVVRSCCKGPRCIGCP